MSRFINGEEGYEHFAAQSRVDVRQYKHKAMLKIWPGQILALYQHQINLKKRELARLKVIDIGVDKTGCWAKLINLTTGNVQEIRHIPQQVHGFDVVVCFPQRTIFEKTVKIINDNPSYGVCSGLLVHHKNSPAWEVVGDDYLDTLNNVGEVG